MLPNTIKPCCKRRFVLMQGALSKVHLLPPRTLWKCRCGEDSRADVAAGEGRR